MTIFIIILVIIVIIMFSVGSSELSEKKYSNQAIQETKQIQFPNPETANPKDVHKAFLRYSKDELKQIYTGLKKQGVNIPSALDNDFQDYLNGKYLFSIHYDNLNLEEFQRKKYSLKDFQNRYVFDLRGVQFGRRKKILEDWLTYDEVELKPEPTNDFDENAIKVLAGHRLIGYVPREETAEVKEIMKSVYFAFIYMKSSDQEGFVTADIIIHY